MKYRLLGLVLFTFYFLVSTVAFAEINFEGIYVLEIDGHPVGFSVQRNEFDPITGIRKISYLLKTLPSADDVEQFVTLEEDKIGRPLSYHYESHNRQVEMHVDARAEGAALLLTSRTRGGIDKPPTLPLTGKTFFSSSLGQLLVKRNPQPGQAYSFEAISEEEGKIIFGETLILDVKMLNYRKIYRAILRYQGLEQEWWFLDDGISLKVESTSLPVRSVLVANGRVATRVIERAPDLIARYFGSVVSGVVNPVSAGLHVPDNLFGPDRVLTGFNKVSRIPLGLMR